MGPSSDRPGCVRCAFPRWDERSGVHSRRAPQNEWLLPRSEIHTLDLPDGSFFRSPRLCTMRISPLGRTIRCSQSARSPERMASSAVRNTYSRSSRWVLLQIAQAVYDAHFPVGTNDPVFTVGALPRTNGFFRGPKYILSIFWVDYFAHYRQVNGAFLWR